MAASILAPTSFTPLQLKAQRILRAAARSQPTTVMASTPTAVLGATGVSAITVSAGGMNNAVGDVITITGGTLATGGAPAKATVTAVSSGAVTAVKLISPGQYATVPTGPAATTSSGAGTGLTLNITGNGTLVQPGSTNRFPAATVSATGSGYAIGDTLVAVGGTYATRPAKFIVRSISGGVVTQLLVTDCGDYSVLPSTPTTTNATSGSGSGLTVAQNTAGSAQNNAQAWTSSGPQLHPLDPRIQDVSGIWAYDTFTSFGSNAGFDGAYVSFVLNSSALGSANRQGSTNGLGKRFVTNSRYVGWTGYGASGTPPQCNVAVYVTDLATGVRQRTQVADYAMQAANVGNMVDMGSSALRLWEIYFGYAYFLQGFDVELTATVSAPAVGDEIKMAVVGDSYTAGFICTNNTRGAYCYELAARLGCNNPIVNGIGGTGVTATNSGASNSFTQRIQYGNLNESFIGRMDLLALQCPSVNDLPATDQPTLQANIQTYLQAAMNAQPNAIILCLPAQSPPGSAVNVTQAVHNSYLAAVAAVQASRSDGLRLLALRSDKASIGGPWQTGTGSTAAPAYDGNSDVFITEPVKVHPNDAGHFAYARRAAVEAIPALTSIAGL